MEERVGATGSWLRQIAMLDLAPPPGTGGSAYGLRRCRDQGSSSTKIRMAGPACFAYLPG